MVTDAIGRKWQCATEQLDFVQPTRFELEYTAEDGTKKTPVMIHKALLGTIDRFLGVYIEHTAGNFPTWMSPVQVVVLPISEKQSEYAKEVMTALKAAGVRVSVNDANDSLGKRIRATKMEKVPYMLVVGDAEVSARTVSVESRDNGKEDQPAALAEFVARVAQEVRTRV